MSEDRNWNAEGIADGDSFYVFASAHGNERHPDWYHNLKAYPEIMIEVGTDTLSFRASEILWEERDRIFARHVSRFPGFRRIPVEARAVDPRDRA